MAEYEDISVDVTGKDEPVVETPETPTAETPAETPVVETPEVPVETNIGAGYPIPIAVRREENRAVLKIELGWRNHDRTVVFR